MLMNISLTWMHLFSFFCQARNSSTNLFPKFSKSYSHTSRFGHCISCSFQYHNLTCFLLYFIRCQLRDKEVSCREKDTIISELKEKLVRLNSRVRQLETELLERDQELKVSQFFYCSVQLSD